MRPAGLGEREQALCPLEQGALLAGGGAMFAFSHSLLVITLVSSLSVLTLASSSKKTSSLSLESHLSSLSENVVVRLEHKTHEKVGVGLHRYW